jgi:Fur family transcriptional regulator, ferric uptake regulator
MTGSTQRRSTRQGAAVHQAIAGLDGFRSAQDVYTHMKTDGDAIGLSTVYRHLQRLAEQGVVDAIHTAIGETIYRYCRRPADDGCHHHHHLVCTQCGHAEPIESDHVEQWAHDMAHKHGYAQTHHTIEIFGLCQQCGSQSPNSRKNEP